MKNLKIYRGEKFVTYKNEEVSNTIYEWCKYRAGLTGRIEKMMQAHQRREWKIYGDCLSEKFLVTPVKQTAKRYRLIGTVKTNDGTEQAANDVVNIIRDYAKNLYCCQSTARKMTKNKEILLLAYVGEADNPYYKCAAPMQLYNRYMIEYLTTAK